MLKVETISPAIQNTLTPKQKACRIFAEAANEDEVRQIIYEMSQLISPQSFEPSQSFEYFPCYGFQFSDSTFLEGAYNEPEFIPVDVNFNDDDDDQLGYENEHEYDDTEEKEKESDDLNDEFNQHQVSMDNFVNGISESEPEIVFGTIRCIGSEYAFATVEDVEGDVYIHSINYSHLSKLPQKGDFVKFTLVKSSRKNIKNDKNSGYRGEKMRVLLKNGEWTLSNPDNFFAKWQQQ